MKNKEEQQYLDLLKKIKEEGVFSQDRTGVGTYKLFGNQMRFDLSKGFPLLTTKKVFWKGMVHETLWFLRGDTNIKYLNDNGVHIWDQWAGKDGELGKIYSHQWRNLDNIDQIQNIITEIKNNPESRRLLVNSWNVYDLPDMALAPCHCLFQFQVSQGRLNCQLYQRSADSFIGLPFNIASYALLTHIIASICNLEVGEFIHTLGDYHIYSNHLNAIDEQLQREPRDFPKLVLKRQLTSIDDLRFDDFELVGYNPHPAIKAPVAV